MGKESDLFEAAKCGNFDVIAKLFSHKSKKTGPLASLRRPPEPNIQDGNGYSALHYASLYGYIDIVRLLLANDASPNLVEAMGSSSLHLAAWGGHQEICKILLTNTDKPANPNLQTVDCETPLHCAAQHGHIGVLATLLAHGADPSLINARHETPLDLAAQYGRIQAVQMLIRANPDLLAAYKTQAIVPHSPLHLASRNGHKSVVETLLSAGVHVNLVTPAGTALHESALCGRIDIVRLLLDAKIDPELSDCQGKTPLENLRQFPTQATHDMIEVFINHQRVQKARRKSLDFELINENEMHSSFIDKSNSPKVCYDLPPQKPPRRCLSVSSNKFIQNSLSSMMSTSEESDSSDKRNSYSDDCYCDSYRSVQIHTDNTDKPSIVFNQPPTPEHSPPQPLVAELQILQRIAPLCKEYQINKNNQRYSKSSTSSTYYDFEHAFVSLAVSCADPIHDRSNHSLVFIWLYNHHLEHLQTQMLTNGFDNINFINGLLELDDLSRMERDHSEHERIMAAVNVLPQALTTFYSNYVRKSSPLAIDNWLKIIDLEQYLTIFKSFFYEKMERMCDVWDTELETVFEIHKIGHRKRILLTISTQRKFYTTRFNDDNTNSPINMSAANTNKNVIELRMPTNLIRSIPVGITTNWRHPIDTLLNGFVSYFVKYIGSKHVQNDYQTCSDEIQYVCKEQNFNNQMRTVVILITHQYVQLIDLKTKEIILEHPMKTIDCANQDDEDLLQFSYITKDIISRNCYRHTFEVSNMDLSLEIMLTFGQAFEIAYQLVLNKYRR